MAKTIRPITDFNELVKNPTIHGTWLTKDREMKEELARFHLYLASLDHALMVQNDSKYTNHIMAGTVAAAFLQDALSWRTNVFFDSTSAAVVSLGLTEQNITDYGRVYHQWVLYRHNEFPPNSLLMFRWTKEEYISKAVGRIDIKGIYAPAKSLEASTSSNNGPADAASTAS